MTKEALKSGKHGYSDETLQRIRQCPDSESLGSSLLRLELHLAGLEANCRNLPPAHSRIVRDLLTELFIQRSQVAGEAERSETATASRIANEMLPYAVCGEDCSDSRTDPMAYFCLGLGVRGGFARMPGAFPKHDLHMTSDGWRIKENSENARMLETAHKKYPPNGFVEVLNAHRHCARSQHECENEGSYVFDGGWGRGVEQMMALAKAQRIWSTEHEYDPSLMHTLIISQDPHRGCVTIGLDGPEAQAAGKNAWEQKAKNNGNKNWKSLSGLHFDDAVIGKLEKKKQILDSGELLTTEPFASAISFAIGNMHPQADWSNENAQTLEQIWRITSSFFNRQNIGELLEKRIRMIPSCANLHEDEIRQRAVLMLVNALWVATNTHEGEFDKRMTEHHEQLITVAARVPTTDIKSFGVYPRGDTVRDSLFFVPMVRSLRKQGAAPGNPSDPVAVVIADVVRGVSKEGWRDYRRKIEWPVSTASHKWATLDEGLWSEKFDSLVDGGVDHRIGQGIARLRRMMIDFYKAAIGQHLRTGSVIAVPCLVNTARAVQEVVPWSLPCDVSLT